MMIVTRVQNRNLFKGLCLLLFVTLLIGGCQKTVSESETKRNRLGRININDFPVIKAVEKDGKTMLSIKKPDGTQIYSENLSLDGFIVSAKKVDGKLVVNILPFNVKDANAQRTMSILASHYKFYPDRYVCDGQAIEMCEPEYQGAIHIVEDDDCNLHLHFGNSGPVITGYAEIETSDPRDTYYLNCFKANDPSNVIE